MAEPINLTAHDPAGLLPCLCRRCISRAPQRTAAGGLTFIRSSAVAGTRVLHFWMPEELAADEAAVAQSVKSAMLARFK